MSMIMKSRDEVKGFTNLARKRSALSDKGLIYCEGRMPQSVWYNGINMSGDPKYWEKNDWKEFKKWIAKHPEYK